MNNQFGPGIQPTVGQARPGVDVPDHRDAEGVAPPASNRRITAITGIVLGVIPVLSLIGLIVSIVAFAGYRKAGAKPTLAIVGIVVSAVVLIATVVTFLFARGLLG